METKRANNWSFNWDPRIIQGALEHQGKAFSYTIFSQGMSRTNALSSFISPSKNDKYFFEAQKRANTLVRDFPGVTTKTRYGKTDRGEKGYTITCNIPELVSAQCYAELFVNEGLPFRDHLLKNRRDKLLEICKSSGIFAFSKVLKGNSFCIACSGILDYLDDPPRISYHFKDFGMTNLDNIAQCYGFVLAVSEVLKEDFFKGQNYVVRYISLENSNSAISLRFEIIEDEAPLVLDKW